MNAPTVPVAETWRSVERVLKTLGARCSGYGNASSRGYNIDIADGRAGLEHARELARERMRRYRARQKAKVA